MLQYIPIDENIAFGRPVTHRGGKQMHILNKVVGVFLGAFLLVAVVIAGVQILVDKVCAAINTSIGLSLLKEISDPLYRCFS